MGLCISFKDIRNKVYHDMEEDRHGRTTWADPTLLEVITVVERRAIRNNLLDIVSGGKEIAQNDQVVQKGGQKKMTKAQKTAAKDKRTIIALQQQVNESGKQTKPAVVNQNAAVTAKGVCSHGKKCWLKDCKYTHDKGHKPAPDPKTLKCATCERMGHTADQCGKCYKCGAADHSYRSCPKRNNKTVSQNAQQIIQSGPSVEDEDGGILMRL